MKKLVSEPKGCLTLMLSLIFICEVLLNTGHVLLQFLGILMLPLIGTSGVLLVKSGNKNA